MNKIFSTLTLVFFMLVSFTAFSQEKFWVGLDLNFNSVKVGDGDGVSSFGLSPTLGYMFSDNMGIGLEVNFRQPHEDHTIFGATPFLRYGKSVGDKATLFGDLGVGFSTGKETIGTVETKNTVFGIGISPGVMYKFADRWSAIGHFGFLGFTSDSEEVGSAKAVKTTDFGIDLKMSSLDFGLQYHF
ncbi:MAG: porin family protein [Saprospiraceae bacterium]|nr:porin family protein [Candidatus Vicinibacter affinis]